MKINLVEMSVHISFIVLKLYSKCPGTQLTLITFDQTQKCWNLVEMSDHIYFIVLKIYSKCPGTQLTLITNFDQTQKMLKTTPYKINRDFLQDISNARSSLLCGESMNRRKHSPICTFIMVYWAKNLQGRSRNGPLYHAGQQNGSWPFW